MNKCTQADRQNSTELGNSSSLNVFKITTVEPVEKKTWNNTITYNYMD